MNDKTKKILRLCLILGIVVIVGLVAYFFFHTKDYWQNQMKIQNEQLELRTPEGVDSLLAEIAWRDSVMDVWGKVVERNSEIIDSVQRASQAKVDACQNDNRILQNVIDHQNQMISNLQKNQKWEKVKDSNTSREV